MKNSISILLMLMILSSCSSTKKNAKTNPGAEQTTSSTTPGTKDGASYENAIVINERSETSGVRKEYEWLKKNYPGYQSLGQSLNHKNGKSYDIIKIKTAEGIEKSFYFDISKFFGKF